MGSEPCANQEQGEQQEPSTSLRLSGAPMRVQCSVVLTGRAAFGGPLAARELWFGRISFPSLFLFTLVYGDVRQWPDLLWCFLPDC